MNEQPSQDISEPEPEAGTTTILPASDVFQQEILPNIEVVSWDFSSSTATLRITIDESQIIDSVGYGWPSLYVLGGCNQGSAYDYSLTESLGTTSRDAANNQASASNSQTPNPIAVSQYSITILADGIAEICFIANYRDGDGQPAQSLIKHYAPEGDAPLRGTPLESRRNCRNQKTLRGFD